MTREFYVKDKDPVHQALYHIIKKLLKGMDVKTGTPTNVRADGEEIEESHSLPVFHITEFSRSYPNLHSVTSYIAPFLGADEKIPDTQRRVLDGHVAAQGFAILGNSYSAIRLIVNGKPESIILKDHTQG
jgi:hypothetical protein